MKYSDEMRIEKIIEYTDKLLAFLKDKNITREVVNEDESVRWAITTPLYNIGEHVYYLSEEFRSKNNDIPWAKISGLRHRLVHDYEDTNWNIICEVLFEDLPKFQEQLHGFENK